MRVCVCVCVCIERGIVTDSLSELAHFPPLMMHILKVEELTHLMKTNAGPLQADVTFI